MPAYGSAGKITTWVRMEAPSQECLYELDDCGITAAAREERWVENKTQEIRNRFKAQIIGPDGITDEEPYEHHFSSWVSRNIKCDSSRYVSGTSSSADS